MLQTGQHQVNVAPPGVKGPAPKTDPRQSCRVSKARLRAILPVPVATLVALAVHLYLPNNELPNEAHLYSAISWRRSRRGSVAAVMVQFVWPRLRRWMWNMCPIFAAAILTLCLWELITGVLHWLPLPYFPAPAGVLQSMVNDRALLFDSTWHSLAAVAFGLCAGRGDRLDYRRLHRLVHPHALLGHAVVESGWPDSRHRLDSAGHGGFAVRDVLRGGS